MENLKVSCAESRQDVVANGRIKVSSLYKSDDGMTSLWVEQLVSASEPIVMPVQNSVNYVNITPTPLAFGRDDEVGLVKNESPKTTTVASAKKYGSGSKKAVV